MVYADSLDFYEVRRMGALTGDNLKTLSRCYLPLIGVEALGVYFALYWDLTSATNSVETHQSFFRRTLVSSGVFERSLSALEAIGLVKTFRKKEKPASYFVYCIYPPMDAPSFMADPLTAPTLKGVIGDEAFARLSATISKVDLPEDMEEETTDFFSYFKSNIIANAKNEKRGQRGPIPLTFSTKLFVRECSELGLPVTSLSEAEINKCSKLATFYDLSEKTMASFCFDYFDAGKPAGKRIDFEGLAERAQKSLSFKYMRKRNESGKAKSDISTTNQLSELVRLMDEMKPYEFLSAIQNYHQPAKSDLKLLQKLDLDLGLPWPCINAVVSYVLDKNNNVLSAAYCEKIAASVVREGCQTARDAMEYLLRVDRNKKAKAKSYAPKYPQNPAIKKEEVEEVSDEEIDSLLEDIDVEDSI